MMSEQQQARFDAVCREIDEHLFEHSVLSGRDEGVMREYVGIIEEVSGKEICKMAVDELSGYRHGVLVAQERAKR